MWCERGHLQKYIYFYFFNFPAAGNHWNGTTARHMQKCWRCAVTDCMASVLLLRMFKHLKELIVISDTSHVHKTALDSYRSAQANTGGQRNVINFSPLRRSRLKHLMNASTHMHKFSHTHKEPLCGTCLLKRNQSHHCIHTVTVKHVIHHIWLCWIYNMFWKVRCGQRDTGWEEKFCLTSERFLSLCLSHLRFRSLRCIPRC